MRAEFEKQIERLKSVYGDRVYQGERKEIFWQRFADISAFDFKKAVDNLIACEQYAPMLPKFEAVLLVELKNAADAKQEKLLSQLPHCTSCDSTGAKLYVHTEQLATYAFQCHCSHGKIKCVAYPRVPMSGKWVPYRGFKMLEAFDNARAEKSKRQMG